MKSENVAPKKARAPRTLDEEIAAQREKLRKLELKQREQLRKERERNQKSVLELIKTERLDSVPSEVWREAMPKLKALLLVEDHAKTAEPAKPE
jgi:nucleosome binding factor SPN SPT16 subunit